MVNNNKTGKNSIENNKMANNKKNGVPKKVFYINQIKSGWLGKTRKLLENPGNFLLNQELFH